VRDLEEREGEFNKTEGRKRETEKYVIIPFPLIGHFFFANLSKASQKIVENNAHHPKGFTLFK